MKLVIRRIQFWASRVGRTRSDLDPNSSRNVYLNNPGIRSLEMWRTVFTIEQDVLPSF
jgi:hypothetical protein